MTIDRGPEPWPDINDRCPKRGPGLTHTIDGSNICLHCGSPLRIPMSDASRLAWQSAAAETHARITTWEMGEFPIEGQRRLAFLRWAVAHGRLRGDTAPAPYQWKGTRRILAAGLD